MVKEPTQQAQPATLNVISQCVYETTFLTPTQLKAADYSPKRVLETSGQQL